MPMKYRLTQELPHGSGLKWRHRRQESARTQLEHDALENARELFAATRAVARRVELSPVARQLYRALRRHDDYVICIDIHALATRMQVSEQKIHGCLHELHRAGLIGMWIGNLVFFD